MTATGRRSKIALALAGGGPVGGIYEVGAMAALAEALEGVDFTTFDIYVGVSSGALLSASVANGLGPAALARMLVEDDSTEVFDPGVLLRPAFGEYLRRALSVPVLFWSSLRQYLADPWHVRLLEAFQGLSHAIPTGVFNNAGIDELLGKLFSSGGRSNDFRKLKHRLFLVATDLDSGESVAFGSAGHDDVPISVAVQASAALPGLFPPVRIGERYFVDGALIKTLHASVALHAGAELVICINPLVPFDSRLAARRPPHERPTPAPAHLVEGGLPVVLSQTFRAIIHSRMRTGMDRYRLEFKDADVVLFEPSRDDADMFFTNVFSYRGRSRLCEHAYQRTRKDLYQRRHELRPIFERHGIHLNLGVLKDHTRSLLSRRRRPDLATSVSALDSSLADLELWLQGQEG
ncbi:MAG: Patatin [Candidatus Accumulibacter regalis]|jgi:NTE family protein|uniref:Patatin n=1 Tax=Accumulibacter regalis TaxID=522306 RepID=A0A011PCT2_ACCRE|nr:MULTISPECIES: patatin-like phospholipase family protein [unclassified Candidatus Accumulibacter]EXI85386.1 MAG: Patatin [Candidatus Accumulibacter regalis]MBL8366959.1 patatin-like phospholipase family protein [Accumulibacter sp.]MBN8514696.1 patatin-like phospholipase family protein [Accumulibacter sp.]MBO3702304.1 patatin-like phospholipase family protein [Accumulibacter sp.]HRE70182.1 patatin-like phospholipase family protein [Accumulibacter sp.]